MTSNPNEKPDMEPGTAARISVRMSLVFYYADGTKSVVTWDTPIDEAPSERTASSLLAGLLKAPVYEGGTPRSLVSFPPPLTDIECRLQVLQDSIVMPAASDFPDSEFSLSNLKPPRRR